MSQNLPVVAPLERALYLRSLHWFRELSGRELVILAQLMREEWLRRGTVLLEAGQRVRAVHLVIEGTVRCEQDGHPCEQRDTSDAVGLLELLADVESRARVSADTNVLALVIDGPALFDVIEDHFSLFLHLRAALGSAIQMLRATGGPENRPAPDAVADAAPAESAELDPVEQLIWLRRSLELRAFGISVLPALIRAGGEIRLRSGEVLWEREAEPRFLALVVRGAVACSGPGGTYRAGPGAVLGLEAVFCGLPHVEEARAVGEVVAIRIDAAALLDVAEDHFHVAARILAYAAGRIVAMRDQAPTAATAAGDAREAAA